MRRVVVLFAASMLLLASSLYLMRPMLFTAYAAAPEPVRATPQSFYHKDAQPDINQIFELVNNERALHGLQPLTRSTQLTKVAAERAADMAANHYYAHRNPKGLYFYDLFKQDGISVAYACENLDLEFTTIASVYVNDWLNSTHGHRECMLNADVREAGYAVTDFTPPQSTPNDTPTYIVVTIYSEPSTKIAQK